MKVSCPSGVPQTTAPRSGAQPMLSRPLLSALLIFLEGGESGGVMWLAFDGAGRTAGDKGSRRSDVAWGCALRRGAVHAMHKRGAVQAVQAAALQAARLLCDPSSPSSPPPSPPPSTGTEPTACLCAADRWPPRRERSRGGQGARPRRRRQRARSAATGAPAHVGLRTLPHPHPTLCQLLSPPLL